MFNTIFQTIGTYPPSSAQPQFYFKKDENCKKTENIFAESCLDGKKYSLDEHTFKVLPYSRFDHSLEDTVKELLKKKYIPLIQNERIIWKTRNQQSAEDICDLIFDVKKKTLKQKFNEAITSLEEAEKKLSYVDDPLSKANFLEKLDKELLQKLEPYCKERVERLLLEKDAVRRSFEIFLRTISNISSPQINRPSCFVCFSLGEDNISKWLEETFVPDLERAGMEPLFCLKQNEMGKVLDEFQLRIHTADYVAIICTKKLKQKCEERANSPEGVALEIELAKDRLYEESELKGTTYPIYLIGDYKTACPPGNLESLFGANFTLFDRSTSANFLNYYGAAFELFGNMRGIDRPTCRKIRKIFIEQTNDILCNKNINLEGVRQWRAEKEIFPKFFKDQLEQTSMQNLGSSPIQRECLHLNVPLPNFVGRETILEQLTRDFSFPIWKPINPTVVRILHGPGGIGKTETALKFANDFLEKFSLVWFIHTESQVQYECDYRNLAQSLHLETQTLSFDEVRKKVHQTLECRGHISLPWLLIYDNVESPIEIPLRGGYVLKTTQNKNIWDSPEVFIEIQPFTTQDTIQLFKKFQHDFTEQDLHPLVELLEGFPVLIEPAAIFIIRNLCPIQEYLKEIHSDDEALWKSGDSKRYPKTLGQVFERNLRVLKQNNPEAFEFFKCCSYLNPERISVDLLDFWCNKNGKITRTKRNIIGTLIDSSLIRFNLTDQTFSIHQLLQKVLSKANQSQDGKDYFTTVNTISLWSKNFNRRNQESWNIGNEISHHFDKLRSHRHWLDVSNEDRYNLLFTMGIHRYYVLCEYSKQAAEFLQESLALAKACFGEESVEVAKGCSELGLCLTFSKNLEEARPYLLTSLEIRKKLFGNVHHETAKCYNHLSLLEKSGSEERLSCCRTYLDFMRNIHQDKPHQDIALGYHSVAECFLNMGKYQEAFENSFQATNMFKMCYKKLPHIETIASYLLLGIILMSLKKETDAIDALKLATQMSESLYGKNHPRVVLQYLRLANSFTILEKYDAALTEYDKALEASLTLYGPTSLEVAKIYDLQSELFNLQRQYEKALFFKQKRLEISQQIYLTDCYDLGDAYFDVGYDHYNLGNLPEALFHFKNAIKILNAIGESQSSLAFKTNYNIGLVLSEQKNHLEALPHFIIALKGKIKTQCDLPSTFFQNTVQSLVDQTDKEYATAVKDDLLKFCLTECDPNSDYVIQLKDLQLIF